VAGDGGDLNLGAAHQRQPGDGSAAQVMERHTDDARVAALAFLKRCH
jgi:hypothetical protein